MADWSEAGQQPINSEEMVLAPIPIVKVEQKLQKASHLLKLGRGLDNCYLEWSTNIPTIGAFLWIQ